MRILVCGGAGYIGSVTTAGLLAQGHDPVVVDDLSRGHREAVPPGVELQVFDLRDRKKLLEVMQGHRIEAVMHFAARSLVGESMERPLEYFDANVGGMLSLLGAMEEAGVGRIILSSTAAVYGEPEEMPIREGAALKPTNPYGHSKMMCEQLLRWQARRGAIHFASLRYFNAAGASEQFGEDHDPETHLIPLALQAAAGRRPGLTIFGEDYPTPDGTCVRDYIHIEDLAEAHILALKAMETESGIIVNLGNGKGFSVKEVVEATRAVTGREFPVEMGARRPGDPPVLVASSEKARAVLGWKPKHADLESIVSSAWDWLQRHPDGYAA